MEVWERVPWCSKSFSPRRGSVGWVEEDVLGGLLGMRGIKGGGGGEGYEERAERKRKSWGSSLRSVSVGSGGARWGESSSRSAILGWLLGEKESVLKASAEVVNR